MVAPLVAAGIGAGLNVVGGLTGELLAGKDEAERERLMRLAADEYGNVSAPALQQIIAQEAGQSAMAGAPTQFGNQGARNAAIQALMNEGLSGGNTLETQLAQSNAQRAAGQAARQGSQTALASAAGRGMGGSAATLQAQLLGASQGADRAAQVGLQGAADARRNALQALAQGGGMAGQAEEADANADARRRESLDRMAMFNAGQRQRTGEFNSGLQQQNFQNSLSVADRRAGANEMRADIYGERARRKRAIAGGVGQAAGQFGTAYGMGGK